MCIIKHHLEHVTSDSGQFLTCLSVNDHSVSWWSLQTSGRLGIADDDVDEDEVIWISDGRNQAPDPGTITQCSGVCWCGEQNSPTLDTQETDCLNLNTLYQLIIMTIMGAGRWLPLVTKHRTESQCSHHHHTRSKFGHLVATVVMFEHSVNGPMSGLCITKGFPSPPC